MKRKAEHMRILICIIIMILLIMDTPTAILGAAMGIELCIKSVIPSLFPFFIVSSYLNSILQGHCIPLTKPLQKVLNLSAGTVSLLLLGLTGGYPVGAQLVTQAYRDQQIDKRTGHILLGYCNNPGPAFIFGITGMMFSSSYIPLLLWGIQIFSAILTGYLLPRPEYRELHIKSTQRNSVTDALNKSLNSCTLVCGWIILFKIILSYINALLVESVGLTARTIITGFLELSNGCLQLADISNEPLRFILCSTLLSFGGLCVLFQTASTTNLLGLGLYLPGKIMQTSISAIISALLTFVLFPNETIWKPNFTCILVCAMVLLIVKEAVKRYRNSI